ncbi:MAG: hypothetical protein Q8N37_04935, partial [bacterium]|nr:hypothetical protein [bacterium]
MSVFNLLPSSAQAVAGAPKILNYQGRLLNNSGDLLGVPPENYCFRFSIYNDVTVGAPDSKIWPTGTPLTMIVNVRNGIFNAGVGDTAAGGDLLDYNFQDNDTVFLNVDVAAQVSGSCAGVTFDNLSPRQRIVSSGFAVNANTVGGFTPSQTPAGNQIPVLNSGALNLAGAVNAGGLTLGTASSITGIINLKNSANSNTVSIQSGITSSPYTLTLPVDDGTPNQFLQTNGTGTLSWVTIGGGGDALVANPLSQFALTTSLQLKGVISDETGSGALVFGTAPTIAGGSIGALTSFGVRSTGTGAFDLKLANTENLTVSDKTLTVTLNNANRVLTISGDATISGANTGDQTSIVGITGTTAQFNTALSDADFATGGGTATGTNTGDSAANSSSTFIGMTSVALNRASGALVLTGITSIDGSAATVSGAAQTNITSLGTLTGLSIGGTETITSASATALVVGASGVTNPAFKIDASTVSSATGLNIKSAAAAGGVALSVLSSGVDEALNIDAKG